MAHGTCDPKTGDAGTDAGFGHELEHDFIESAKVFARIRLFVDRDKMTLLLPVIAEACVRSPDIGRQNHFSKFLQRRPSRSISSSDSFGPQVPAGWLGKLRGGSAFHTSSTGLTMLQPASTMSARWNSVASPVMQSCSRRS